METQKGPYRDYSSSKRRLVVVIGGYKSETAYRLETFLSLGNLHPEPLTLKATVDITPACL